MSCDWGSRGNEFDSRFNLTKNKYEMLQSRRIYLPPLSLIGPGALKDLGEELKALPYKKALFVTDKILVQIGVAQNVIDVLKTSNIEVVTFDNVQPNPTVKNVNNGLKLLQETAYNFRRRVSSRLRKSDWYFSYKWR